MKFGVFLGWINCTGELPVGEVAKDQRISSDHRQMLSDVIRIFYFNF